MKKAGRSCRSISNTNKEFASLKRKEIFRNSHYSLSSLIIWMKSARDKDPIHSKLNEAYFIGIESLHYLLQKKHSVIREVC